MKTQTALALVLVLSLVGCHHKPAGLSGVYEAQIGKPPEHISLAFRSDQKVEIRRLSEKNPFVVESDYTVKNGRLSIKQFGFVAMNAYLELNIQGDTLIAANGDGFIKSVPGKAYTPVERANAEVEAQANLAAARLQEEQNKAAHLQLENMKIAAQEAEFKLRVEEVRKQVEADAERAKAEAAKAETGKAEAIERRKAAKSAAVTGLPHFTNQVATIHTVDGAVYTNVLLIKAIPGGIMYGFSDRSGAGLLSYTNVVLEDLVKFGVDTNIVPSAEELAELKVKDAEYRKQQATGAVANDEARRKYISSLADKARRGDRQAYQTLKGMGLSPYTGSPLSQTSEQDEFRRRYGLR